MSLYPSLEDMKVDKMARAEYALINQQQQQYSAPPASASAPMMYPSLGNYMGLELSDNVIALNMPEYTQSALQQATTADSASGNNAQWIAPISGSSVGLARANVTHGIRELTLCKDKANHVGMRVKDINKGIFAVLVVDKSPAALAGLRFGDQILQINDVIVAGFSMEKVHDLIRKSPKNGIKVVVRDRPFERTITLHKDSTGCIGFQFKNGKIVSIVKDSSASRNGVLIEHQLLEVDGQNVVGLKDKETRKIIDNAKTVVTITVIPTFIYDHMVKKMAGSLIKELMDHTIPSM
ncbi:unnamed protein product [Brassicogethes aeneus]|uniref:PDZ domain-containing protein n=1 Tax=Brassicogethes aeneus TaxID=1431903 RepID=A0A9P0B3T9_BRAAE|nr:unnamed protein product [Brassicogethes aeneus]